jgi:hypothetical protein
MTRTTYVYREGQVVERPKPASNTIESLEISGDFAALNDALDAHKHAIVRALGGPAVIRRRNFHVSETLTAEDRERRREPQPREKGQWR